MERRNVTAPGNNDAEFFVAAFVSVILVQPLAENARIVAHNVIVAGVVVSWTPKRVGAYLLLCNLRLATPQLSLADILEKVGEQRRP